ncbi:MAG: TPM domain-containing protein [Candidatus Cybelea sp.]
MSVRLLFALVALLYAAPAVAAGAGFTIPPTPARYVTDNANALTENTRASLENELHAYESATGHQIVVWIGQTTGDVPLETWTGETADHWKIGRHGKDDGAVLFLFMQDHKARIEVGYGLESALTDADSFRIITDVIRPRMRANDVDGAVSGGVAAMLKTITPSYAGVAAPVEEAQTQAMTGKDAIVLAILGLIFLFAIIALVRGAARRGFLVTGGGFGGGGFGGGGFGGGGFSAGGGGFGGGGASGGW